MSRLLDATPLTSRAFSTSSAGVPEIVAELPLFTEWRHDFHRNPELGYEEHRTAGKVAERLYSFGVDRLETGVATTGVVATIVGRHEPPEDATVRSLGFRADMDCLAMQEENDVPHRSTVDGRFHGCGHDGHTTMLLAAAKHLAATRNFAGSVHLFFQPAEEGLGGGEKMVREGLFDRFPTDEVYGMHNWPELPSGVFGIKAGPLMAAADRFDICISGKGGHAAMPHLAIDPVLIGCQLVTLMQGLVSRGALRLPAPAPALANSHAGPCDYLT